MADVESLLKRGDWKQWAEYFGKMFPTANNQWIEDMCNRMLRTLGYDGPTHKMDEIEYYARLEQLSESVDRLPPDEHNLFMRGEQ